MDQPAALVAREPELAALAAFLGSGRRALLLTGAPGIGKTTLWEAGIARARAGGQRVLAARPSDAEAQLSFTGLIDLLDAVPESDLAGLPAPQRGALEVALLRREPAGGAPEPRAIALGVLNALRALAAAGPVLVAIDDLQWLDPPSSEALAFAARRLEDAPVRFLLARRPRRVAALERAFGRATPERLDVGPLDLDATRRLLAERLGVSVSRPVLRRIADATLGNPLFALELGRTLAERGPPEIGAAFTVPDAVEDALGTRVAALPDGQRRILLAVALSGDVKAGALAAAAGADRVDEAVEAGLLRIDGEHVRAAHPLLGAVARQRSRAPERRALHRALAGAVADPELRAQHLALATRRPDAELAEVVAGAAAAAAARGARQEAVLLAEHALRLTPRAGGDRPERLLALAGHLEHAGELQRMTDLLTPELDALPPGPPRARAWIALSEGAGVRSLDDFERHLAAALAESGDDRGVRAFVLAKRAAHRVGSAAADLPEAEAMAREALALAEGGPPAHERLALEALTWATALQGRPIDALCTRFRAISDAASFLAESPDRIAEQQLVWRGELAAAAEALTASLATADEQGEPVSYALQRLHLCELRLRAGDWDAAGALLTEWEQSAEADLLVPPMFERCRALLAAGRGEAAEAETWAARAIAGASATGIAWDRLEALRARGSAQLLTRDPAAAAESLRAVWAHTVEHGIGEPGAFPVAPDLVDALVELGELDEARAVATRLAAAHGHPYAAASARRCIATIALADDGAGADDLAAAAKAFDALGLRPEAAAALLALGRGQRRRRRWRAAREALERAVAAYEEMESAGWADTARAELDRIAARRARPAGELTPTEARVAQLAASGRSNKEIAQALVVTVHTVEAHLSSSYAKLGIRSRTQLAGRLGPGP